MINETEQSEANNEGPICEDCLRREKDYIVLNEATGLAIAISDRLENAAVLTPAELKTLAEALATLAII